MVFLTPPWIFPHHRYDTPLLLHSSDQRLYEAGGLFEGTPDGNQWTWFWQAIQICLWGSKSKYRFTEIQNVLARDGKSVEGLEVVEVIDAMARQVLILSLWIMSTKIIMKLQLLLKSKSVSSRRVTNNHRRLLDALQNKFGSCSITLHSMERWAPLTSNDSPVGGTDAKHQIVIGLFVLRSLKIPRAVEHYQVNGDVGWWVVYGKKPSWGSQKWVPQIHTNPSYLSNRAIFHFHDDVRKGFLWFFFWWSLGLKPFWHSANNHQRHQFLCFPGTRLRSTTPQTDLHCSMPHSLNDASGERYNDSCTYWIERIVNSWHLRYIELDLSHLQ